LLAVAGTYFACCAAHSGPLFHMVSYAVDCGIAPLSAATLLFDVLDRFDAGFSIVEPRRPQ